jgi:hypothetical protein
VIAGNAGETTTLRTAAATTVSSAVPVFPLLVADIVAFPGRRAVTNPLDETLAMALSDDENTIRADGIGRPMSSRTCAVS